MTTASKSRTPRARSGALSAASGAFQAHGPRGGAQTSVGETSRSKTPVNTIPSLVEHALQTAHESHHGIRVTILVEPGSRRGEVDIEHLPSTHGAPADIEAEQALLGLLLFDNAAFDLVRDRIDATDFYEPFHGRLFSAIEMHIRKGQLAEPVRLIERFKSDPAFEALGGVRYLADLINRTPDASTAKAGASLIRDLANQRRSAPPAAKMDDLGVALAEARIRGAGRAAEILAGPGMLSADQFAALVGVTREGVRQKMIRREILGLQGAKRGVRYPAWQVTRDGGLLPELPKVFALLGDSPWAVYRFLTQPSAAFRGASPLESLRDGKVKPVLEAAEGIARGDFD